MNTAFTLNFTQISTQDIYRHVLNTYIFTFSYSFLIVYDWHLTFIGVASFQLQILHAACDFHEVFAHTLPLGWGRMPVFTFACYSTTNRSTFVNLLFGTKYRTSCLHYRERSQKYTVTYLPWRRPVLGRALAWLLVSPSFFFIWNWFKLEFWAHFSNLIPPPLS